MISLRKSIVFFDQEYRRGVGPGVAAHARGRQAAPESGQGGGEVRGQGCRPGAARGCEGRRVEEARGGHLSKEFPPEMCSML
mgnify:CR=1 FL=1